MLTNKLKLRIGRKPVVLKKSIFYKKLKIVKNIVLKVKNYKRIKNKYLWAKNIFSTVSQNMVIEGENRISHSITLINNF